MKKGKDERKRKNEGCEMKEEGRESKVNRDWKEEHRREIERLRR